MASIGDTPSPPRRHNEAEHYEEAVYHKVRKRTRKPKAWSEGHVNKAKVQPGENKIAYRIKYCRLPDCLILLLNDKYGLLTYYVKYFALE